MQGVKLPPQLLYFGNKHEEVVSYPPRVGGRRGLLWLCSFTYGATVVLDGCVIRYGT